MKSVEFITVAIYNKLYLYKLNKKYYSERSYEYYKDLVVFLYVHGL